MQEKVPKLRYLEQNDKWVLYPLANFLEKQANTIIVQDTNKYQQISISNDGKVSLRKVSEGISIGRKRQFKIDLEKYPNTLTFIRQGLYNGGIGFIDDKNLNGAIVTENMPLLTLHDGLDKTFLSMLLKSTYYKRNILFNLKPTGSAQSAIHEKDWLKQKIMLPTLIEQKKIGNLLLKLDLLINEKEKEIRLIKKSKAKQLDLFFSDTLYDTEIGTLKDYFEILKNYSFSREKESDNGTISHIHYGDIHTSLPSIVTSNTLIPKLEQCTKYDIKDFIRPNDIIIADASEDYKDLGKAIFIDKIKDMKILSGLHTFHLRPYNSIYSLYFKYYTESPGYKKQMARLGTGLSVFGISKGNLVNITFPIPTEKNIIKNIINILSHMDNLINEKETELSKRKEIKKYLINKMLV